MSTTQNSVEKVTQKRDTRLPVEMSSNEINELFAACLPKLQKSARRMFRNAEDSEDALQDALLLAFRKMHQFEGRSSFSTWVHSIVRNTSRAYYRKSIAHPTLSTDQESGEEGAAEHKELVDDRPTPEESYAAKERGEIFQRATDELPERYQAAVYQFYLRGLGEEAAAKALGITVSALKAQLHRSRILLSYQIRKSCVADVKAELLRARPFLRRHREVRLRNRRAVGTFTSPRNLVHAQS